jgi:hypothetical protein
MILPSNDPGVAAGHELQPADVVELSVRSERWWPLAAQIPGPGRVLPALIGLAPCVVWSGAVSRVPCRVTGVHGGSCPCGYHAAPDPQPSHHRGLASVVVSGMVRVLSHGHDGSGQDGLGPVAVVAIDGPLTLDACCDGSQDGLGLDRCDHTVRWVVPASGGRVAAFCRGHARRLTPGVRRRRQSFGEFARWVPDAMARRYGVGVTVRS